ncbi:MAG: zinc ribbon domain-containing protein [Candidatus Rokubacteria bacterium]|nr:zinc ribbon domain-containing protein [Candidatus Rokubacteria bacterium]
MPYPCFHCDVELVPGAQFCHQCGAPTFAAGTSRQRGAATVAEQERVRIKKDVKEAVRVPHSTRMLQTVTGRRASKVPAPPPLWQRVASAPIWRKPYLWVCVVVLGVVAGGWALVEDLQDKARQQNEVYQIVTRLTAACYGDSRTQILERLTRIQSAAGGQMTLLETATLFELITRSVSVQSGDCSRIADKLAKPDRFEALLR